MARRKRAAAEETPGFAGREDRPRLTPVDVQQKVFRLAFRGYNERDVDEFLDQVTEDLAALHEENKRLREQVEEGGAGTGASVQAAKRQAEGILRQAREQAARLAAGTPGGGAPTPSTYLVEERRFLQRVASLVQDHAAWLKEEARRAGPRRSPRRAASEPTAAAEPGAAAPPPEEGEWSPPAATSSVDEPTAAWSPESSSNELSDDAKDPLVSAWESAWAPEEPPGTVPSAKEREARSGEGEPSLRELFWGEE